MLEEGAVQSAAAALFEAEKAGRQIGLLSLEYPEMTMDDAYRIQDAIIAKHKTRGRKQIGWKIGLTSRAMQNALNIDIPDSGVLFDDMQFENGTKVPPGRFIQPRVEAEIAFVMKKNVETPNREAILQAIDYICPSIEILDTRILRADPATGRMRSVFDTISDNAANAGIVLGPDKHNPKDFDLRRIGVIMKRDGVVEETGLGAAVLDDPLLSMQWLAERLGQYGRKITAGDIVLSGSFIKIIEAPGGSYFHADFDAFGSVEISFD